MEGIDRKPMTTPSTISLLVPDLNGDIKDVLTIEVLAKMGEQIAVDQTLAVLETEKRQLWRCTSTSAGNYPRCDSESWGQGQRQKRACDSGAAWDPK